MTTKRGCSSFDNLPTGAAFANAIRSRRSDGDRMPNTSARLLKVPRRIQRHHDRRSVSPRWQFLRGFIKNPVMVGSIIPSSRILIEKMLGPVDWANTRLFVEYGPGVGTFTRPVLEVILREPTLLPLSTNQD